MSIVFRISALFLVSAWAVHVHGQSCGAPFSADACAGPCDVACDCPSTKPTNLLEALNRAVNSQGCSFCAEPAGFATCGCESACDACEPSCGSCPTTCCHGSGLLGSHLEHWRQKIACASYANCSCRGSFKYPVPPLDTYFWPGMYSEQSMVGYNDPFRFPPLEVPNQQLQPVQPLPQIDEAARAIRTAGHLTPASIGAEEANGRPSMSAKLRAMYRIND